MSDLTPAEKQKFERLLGMESGYVLGFSNRTFAEFVLDSTGRNIFDSRYCYASGSKANRLRAFWQKEDNRVVGKLMSDMLDYHGETGPNVETCRLIVERLLGRPAQVPQAQQTTPQTQPSHQHQTSLKLAQLKEEFVCLAAQANRNNAGLALEKLLNRLFELFHLRPRQIRRQDRRSRCTRARQINLGHTTTR